MAACLLSLSACSAKQEDAAAAVPGIETEGTLVTDSMAESLKLSAIQTLGAPMDSLIVQKTLAEAQGDISSAAMYTAQIDVRKELGSIKGIDSDASTVVLLADGSYTVSIPVTFTKGSMQYVLNLNMATQEIRAEFTKAAESDSESGKTIGQLMQTATVYAVIGMGTVFAVLIFISLLIACFKFINKWERGKDAGNKAPVQIPAAAPKAAPAPALSADLSDDAELAAVITAAIAAYEGTSSNGLVVRSIRRVQGSVRR